MRTFITHIPDDPTISSCLRLIKRFYPWDVELHEALPGESKGSQLRRLLGSISDEYLILLESDFFLIRLVDLLLLDAVCKWSVDNKVERFSLQSKNHYLFTNWSVSSNILRGHVVYKANRSVECPFSLEASVWNRMFLLSNLKSSMSTDSDIEREVSAKIKRMNKKVYALDVPVLDYRDACGRGEIRLYLRDDPLRLEADNDDEAQALYLPYGTRSLYL